MKVYLINPPAADGVEMVREGRCMQRKGAWTTVWAPVTLATMAKMLLEENIKVKLDDCIVQDITMDRLKQNIRVFEPDLLVINTATASIYSDLSCAKIAKEVCPDLKTLAFGIHVTMLARESLEREPSLDYIIRGEPEFCLVELVKSLKENKDISDIKGLSYRQDANIFHNENRNFDDDLNNFPYPAWELLNLNNYLLPFREEPFLLVTTSKGCPHKCIFCPAKPYYGAKLRFRKSASVIDEIEYIKNRFKIKEFLIWSESFTENNHYVEEFCNEIKKRNLKIGWVCNSRVDRVNLGLLKMMKQAGCWMIGYGIESSDQEILDSSKKGITIAQIEEAVRLAKKAGIQVTGHVIFGLPGETFQTGIKTIKWLKKLKLDFVQFYCAVPWPSTKLYVVARQNGWLKTEDWRLYEQNFSVLDMPTISAKEVEKLRKIAFINLYLSPFRIMRIVSSIRSFSSLKAFFRTVGEFIHWFR